jgi:hypothetical protein
MFRSLILLTIAGCLGTRNQEPDWLNETNEDGTENEIVIEDSCGGEDTGIVEGFSINGTIQDLVTKEGPPDPAILCAYALDPTPVLSGGEPLVMAASQVCENGEYSVGGLSNPPSIGMFISIADCDNGTPTVMKSATGVDFDDVKNLGDGDSHDDHTAYLVSMELGQTVSDSLVDFDGDAVETGFMSGFVLDVNEAAVGGGSLACGGCADFYYMDTDDTDGLFLTNGTRNAETNASAGAIFVAPAAPIFTYEAADGGVHTWEPQLFGSLPGYASFLLFNATN